MKHRVPITALLPFVVICVTIAFLMVTPNEDQEFRTGIVGMLKTLGLQLINVFKHGLYWIIMFVTIVMLLIINGINRLIENEKFKRLTSSEKEEYIASGKIPFLRRTFQSAFKKQSDKEEESIILDHGFDGIKELDNALPQWWLALFYFGVAFMVIYVFAYSFTDFAHPDVEYDQESQYLEAKWAEWAKNNDITIDQAVNKYKDPAALEQGKQVFESICAQCHTKNAGGGIGPNLTDDYWVNKVQDSLFYNIYDIVYNGSPKNPTMRPFGQRKELSGLTIEKVASYVYYMNQVKPQVTTAEGGAAPQGNEVPQWARKK